MMGYKFERVKDYNGEENVGYKLGDYYLMKVWSISSYNWVINKDGKYAYFICEFDRLYNNNEIRLAPNFKEGKELLIKLFKGEIEMKDIEI